jgi:predicted nucleic acid-binding protein
MGVGYFLDSYAIIEFLMHNPSYESCFQDGGMITYCNVLEVVYSFYVDNGEEAFTLLDALSHLVVEPEPEEIIEATRFRKKHIKKRLSYTDCLGYCIALNRGVPFLTGDKEFKGMKNVTFVK